MTTTHALPTTQKAHKALAKQFIQAKIISDYNWTTKALLTVFANQTADEQQVESTNHRNRLGFAPADASFLSSVAKKVNRYTLSEKQLHVVRRKLIKYWKQVYRVCDRSKLDSMLKSYLTDNQPVS